MKKKAKYDFSYIFLLLIIILVSFLLTYMVFTVKIQEQETNTFKQDISVKTPPQVKKISLTIDEVIDSNNVNYCKYILDKNERKLCEIKLAECKSDDCYYKKAVYNRNEQDCFKINDVNKRVGCSAAIKRSKLFEMSVLENNIGICDLFEEDSNKIFCRDNFYLAQEYNQGITTNCNKIQNEDLRRECLN